MGLGMILVHCMDFFLTILTIITIGLAVWHVFDESVGTELDWLVAIIFMLATFCYNILVTYTIEITWNRMNTLGMATAFILMYLGLVRKMIKDSEVDIEKRDIFIRCQKIKG